VISGFEFTPQNVAHTPPHTLAFHVLWGLP